jgi:uncharacterized protein with PQ loop repeat
VTEIIGWVSSMILVLTIGKQIHKQWRDDTSKGVSNWLFIGQVASSAGFITYSWMVNNYVFVVTNSLLLLSALIGLVIMLRHRRSPPESEARSGGREADRVDRLEKSAITS